MDNNTWDAVTSALIDELAANDEQRRSAAAALEFDLDQQRFRAEATLLAESNDKWIARLAPHVDGGNKPDFGDRVEAVTAELVAANVTPIDGATTLLRRLAGTEIPVAMATNDSESSARAQVGQLGWSDFFDAIVGYDSGFGPKPEPGMIDALCERFEVSPAETLMVGDTWADAQAAARAEVQFCLLDRAGQNANRLAADYVVASLNQLAELLAP